VWDGRSLRHTLGKWNAWSDLEISRTSREGRNSKDNICAMRMWSRDSDCHRAMIGMTKDCRRVILISTSERAYSSFIINLVGGSNTDLDVVQRYRN
jgi:hypothetical protein